MFKKNCEREVHRGEPVVRHSICSIRISDMKDALLGARFVGVAKGVRRVVINSTRVFPVLVALVLVNVPLVYAQEAGEEQPQMVYPNSSSTEESDESQSEVYKDLMPEGGPEIGMAVTILGYLIILGGLGVAAWYLFKRGVIRKPFSSSEGKLKVAESRMLGNRQYIMVVEYEEKKILLGVGPGKIDYLTSLDGYRSEFPKIEPELERVSVQEMA